MSFGTLVSPESVGISSGSIRRFLDRTQAEGLELHRFLLLRHGKCASLVTYAPYGEEDLHPLYSFSKSLTATAIGFARQEGLLSLEERIADLFPEALPESPSENLLSCTVHHLLCMSCGQETLSEDDGPDWIRSFFAVPFVHAPGTFYLYNTPGTNLLAAIIQRKTGQSVTEYLRPRLFDPLGIGEVYAHRLPDEGRTEHGGGGMKMKLWDMARFSQFMLDDGVWEGKPLLPGWYHAMAGRKQMETAGDAEGHVKEWAKGYGYQCWMGSLPSSFRADGAFGQFGLIYPTLDLCVVMNAATEQTQSIMDAVNEVLLPGVGKEDPGQEGEALVERRSLPALLSCRNPYFEGVLNGRTYEKEPGRKMSSLPLLVGGAGLLAIEEAEEITGISFAFGEKDLLLSLQAGEETQSLMLGRGRWVFTEAAEREGKKSIRYAGCLRWRGLRRLELEVRRTDALSGVRLILTFEGRGLTLEADETLMTDGGLGMVQRPLAAFFTKAPE